MRKLALEHASGALGDETYLERMKHLRSTLAEVEETRHVGVQADRAVEWLRTLSATWDKAMFRKRGANCSMPSTSASS